MTDGDAAAAAAAPPSPKERRLKLMLIASLAFNLLVVGAVAGAMIFGPHGPRHRGGSPGDEYGLMGFTRALSSDRRGPIRKAIKEQRETFKPLREAVDEARREAADVLVEEPFSKDKLKQAFDKINEADVKLKSAGQAHAPQHGGGPHAGRAPCPQGLVGEETRALVPRPRRPAAAQGRARPPDKKDGG